MDGKSRESSVDAGYAQNVRLGLCREKIFMYYILRPVIYRIMIHVPQHPVPFGSELSTPEILDEKSVSELAFCLLAGLVAM